ncbi:outer membrane protein assembly factor BamA [uncultured Cohaesibacter sp.]|uniref:outer membrane protein assembly factor BamA n=1 Tax=uncultured Cohaesibacter sp. TaxID=1002546 RepID=UPI00292DCD51|nr:outer membrane protein assembly factor BamA [uncultured Cohaesibacter sp.]
MNNLKTIAWGAALATVLSAGVPLGPIDFLSASPAFAQSVSRVVVKGNARVSDDTIRSYLTLKPGQRSSAYEIDESLKALYQTGLFKDVDIRMSGSSLVVSVQENAVINRIAFEGNKRIKDKDLDLVVTSKSRGILSESRIQTDVQRILEAYRRAGRFGARVEPKIIDLGRNRADLVFEIVEGGKTPVSRVSVLGNNAFSDGRLRNVLKTKETGWLSWLTSNDVYDADRLAADEERLRKFYLNHGYADFRIVSSVADLDRERNVFFVAITVDEGEQYRIGDVEIDSAVPEVDAEALRRQVHTDGGDVYSMDAVSKSLEDITIEISKSGYAFARVTPRADRDYENKIINLVYQVDEGTRAYVERINIRGNTRTRDYVIRREFDMAEGDAFNRVMLDRAKRRLDALGFFEKIDVTTAPGSSPDRVVLNVDVKEKGTGSVTLGGGYSTSDGFIADIAVTETNFMGRGQYLKVSASGGSSSKSYALSFTEPFFLGRRMSAGFDLFHSSYDDNDYREYDYKRIGGTLRFGLPITEALSINPFYTLEQKQITDYEYYGMSGASPAIEQAQDEGKTLKSSIGYSLVYNTLDSMTTPTSGIYGKFQQEFAGLGGDVKFIKSTVDARYYHELYAAWNLVGMLRFGAGHIQGLGGEDVRLLDAFNQGGDTIRGFASYGFGPRDITSGEALGGKTYVNATAELQFPLPYLDTVGLSGAVFADAGTLFGSDAASGTFHDEHSIRSSIGAGVIWASPFGRLRLDYGYALTKEDYDETQVIRFGAASSF